MKPFILLIPRLRRSSRHGVTSPKPHPRQVLFGAGLAVFFSREKKLCREGTRSSRGGGAMLRGFAPARRRLSRFLSAKKRPRVQIQQEPLQWRRVYKAIEEYRVTREAPVDTMGCDRLADSTAPPPTFRFQTLIALMLSSQTKDANTALAMSQLKSGLDGGLSAQSVSAASLETLETLVRPASFHRQKAGHIQQTAARLLREQGGDIPQSVKGLCDLPGVGPKMAMLTMQAAWGESVGIGVDIHVHRIAERLGWSCGAANPEATRVQLESWLPRELWASVNPLLVGFGQTTCSAKSPKCETACPVRNQCPHYKSEVARGRKT